jgi:hypothetical protein
MQYTVLYFNIKLTKYYFQQLLIINDLKIINYLFICIFVVVSLMKYIKLLIK